MNIEQAEQLNKIIRKHWDAEHYIRAAESALRHIETGKDLFGNELPFKEYQGVLNIILDNGQYHYGAIIIPVNQVVSLLKASLEMWKSEKDIIEKELEKY